MPENTVYVGRGSKYGNPYKVEEYGRDLAIKNYKNYVEGLRQIGGGNFEELRDKNLACWCNETEPCHADILLKIANS